MSSTEPSRNVPSESLSQDSERNVSISCQENLFCSRYYQLERATRELGFDAFSLAPVGEAPQFDLFSSRAASGQCANLSYLTDNIELRRSPVSVLPEAQTLIIVALTEKRLREESATATETLSSARELQGDSKNGARGRIVGYATCLDYHDAMRRRLKELQRRFQREFPDAISRVAVDTAPLLEKSWAVASGLGFCGLNSLVIRPSLGSRFFLGELLVSTPFSTLSGYDALEEYRAAQIELRRKRGLKTWNPEDLSQRCLKCRRCVDACPTKALLGDRTLDARRCLNYWTIENREDIPEDIAEALQGRLFGCDLCQQVCPYNASIEPSEPLEIPLDAADNLDEESFRRLFKKTPIFRARLEGVQRVARALRKHAKDANAKKDDAIDDDDNCES